METIKYEAVFGDQSLFDSAPEDAEAVFLSYGNDARPFFYRITPCHEYLICGEWRQVGSISSQTFSAMRRIIKTQVWTVADQKAGRFPEVGCKAIGLYDQVVTVTSVDIRNGLLTVQDENDQCISIYRLSDLKPIETPAEKAKRLRDEWCFEVRSMSKGELYDALLSGELPMPKKEDE